MGTLAQETGRLRPLPAFPASQPCHLPEDGDDEAEDTRFQSSSMHDVTRLSHQPVGADERGIIVLILQVTPHKMGLR